jgi:hypothetical protein
MYINNFLYIHIPKTAGLSIEYELNRIYNPYDNSMWYYHIIEKAPNIIKFLYFYCKIFQKIIMFLFYDKYPLENCKIRFNDSTISIHYNIIDYMQYINKTTFNNMIRFTIVRNPYDRTVSLFRFIYPSFMQDKSNFIKFLNDIKSGKLNDTFFAPQYNYIVDDMGNMKVDNILKFENLNEDWCIFCKKYNIPSISLPKINYNNRKKCDLLDDITKGIIYEIYKIDFIFFYKIL